VLRKLYFRAFRTLFLLLMLIPLFSGCFMQVSYSKDELAGFSDDQLYETFYFQLFRAADSYPDEKTALAHFSPAQRTVYVLNYYDMEVQNGGLCQFFVNSSRATAPYVEEALTTIGAENHRNLYSDFIAENEIDVYDLDSFIIDDIEEYEEQTKRYDFDTYDVSFYELEPLYPLVVEYIRENIDEFAS